MIARFLLRLISSLVCFACLLAATGALAIGSPVDAGESVSVEIRLAHDRGRHTVELDRKALPYSTPGLNAAVAKLLNCSVERTPRGFRCQLRREPEGLTLEGQLDFSALAALLPDDRRQLDLRLSMPRSPGAWVEEPLARALEVGAAGGSAHYDVFRGTVSAADVKSRIGYRAGFRAAWVWVAALIPIPLLVAWLARRADTGGLERAAWIASLTAWVASMIWSGAIWLDRFFAQVPSIDGALLRWLVFAPLFVIVIGQACWLDPRFRQWRLWAFFGAMVMMRPRAAEWMSLGEGLMGSLIAFALVGLWAWLLFARGAEQALLPDGLAARVHERMRALGGGFDLRLDRLPQRGEAGGSARVGSMVSIPAPWLDRLSGAELDAAVLLAAARWRHAPCFAVLIMPALAWEVAMWLMRFWPWLPAAIPALAAGWYWLCERVWHRRIARELERVGERAEPVTAALMAMTPEWGTSALRVHRAFLAQTGRPLN